MEQREAHALEADWLPPVAALAHFEPPPGAYLAAAPAAHKAEKRARYGFRVGALGLLIDPDAGSEVLTMPQIAPLPGTPSGFLGLTNLRGNLVPVYDLRMLLGIAPRAAGTEALVLVFGAGEQSLGVLIDGYPVVLPGLRPLADFPQLPEALQKHVPTGYVQDGAVWLEFDYGTFFDEICSCTNPETAHA